jgi:hypothetical protein
MAGQGRNADGLGTSGTLNVIRFPGDWYGPVEDLVGVRVGATDRTADSFWGEDAQAVHQVDELADGRRSAASEIPWQRDRPVRAEAAAAQQPGTGSRSTLISWRRFVAPIVLVAMLAGAVVTLVGRDGDASRAAAPAVESHAGASLTRSGRKPRHAALVRSAGDRIAHKDKTVSAHTHQTKASTKTKASATSERNNLAVSESTNADRPSVLNDDAGTSHSSETSTAGTTPVGITATKAVKTDTPPAQTRPATTSSHTVSTSTPMSTKLSSSAPASGNALPSPTGLTP